MYAYQTQPSPFNERWYLYRRYLCSCDSGEVSGGFCKRWTRKPFSTGLHIQKLCATRAKVMPRFPLSETIGSDSPILRGQLRAFKKTRNTSNFTAVFCFWNFWTTQALPTRFSLAHSISPSFERTSSDFKSTYYVATCPLTYVKNLIPFSFWKKNTWIQLFPLANALFQCEVALYHLRHREIFFCSFSLLRKIPNQQARVAAEEPRRRILLVTALNWQHCLFVLNLLHSLLLFLSSRKSGKYVFLRQRCWGMSCQPCHHFFLRGNIQPLRGPFLTYPSSRGWQPQNPAYVSKLLDVIDGLLDLRCRNLVHLAAVGNARFLFKRPCPCNLTYPLGSTIVRRAQVQRRAAGGPGVQTLLSLWLPNSFTHRCSTRQCCCSGSDCLKLFSVCWMSVDLLCWIFEEFTSSLDFLSRSNPWMWHHVLPVEKKVSQTQSCPERILSKWRVSWGGSWFAVKKETFRSFGEGSFSRLCWFLHSICRLRSPFAEIPSQSQLHSSED